VIELPTGNLLEHDPELLLTKSTTVIYHPNMTHPDWTAAFSALPEPSAAWMKIRVGQAATGHPTPDDIMAVLQGAGANGSV
jgi:putative DNA primase/helicase